MKIGDTIVFKTLTGGYYANAMGTIFDGCEEWLEVNDIQIIASNHGAISCSHRVGIKNILKHYNGSVSVGKIREEFPEFFSIEIPKEKKLYRNYCSDDPAMYRDIYKYLCEGFDELQKDGDGVSKKDMMVFIMKKSRGAWNPMIVQEIITQFEK